MNKKLIAGAICALTLAGAMAKSSSSSDPVLMTVGGNDVRLSEFEYLYKKNNAQQIEPQTLDEYVDMFVIYKLKVADAIAAGIDTTKAFVNEFDGYADDLAKPYLTDKEFADSLRRRAYDRMQLIVNVDHLMLPATDRSGNPSAPKATLDSLRQLIVDGKASFGSLAALHSIDNATKSRNGNMGWITANMFPIEFENVVYSIPDGQLSEVFVTPYGHHLIRRNASRPNPGMVHARHILLRVDQKSPDSVARQRIDSVYNALKQGADFAALASRLSDDTGSARNGGELPWFGKGRMVAEFDSVAFAIPDGTLSEPFRTIFGYHIIDKLGSRPIPSYEESLPAIDKAFEQNKLADLVASRSMSRHYAKYPSTVNREAIDSVHEIIRRAGGINADTRLQLCNLDMTAFEIEGVKLTVGQIAAGLPERELKGVTGSINVFDNLLKRSIETSTLSVARRHLAEQNTDYRNILGEYRDGILLYEISNRNVWNRATTDTAGLNRFFEANRANYTWQKPHYKGYVVMATTDSVADCARAFLEGKSLTGEELASELRERFGKTVRVERVCTAKGDNNIIDYVAFDGPNPKAVSGTRSYWGAWFPYQGRIIDSPEEASDVKGAVATDYQQQLETEWIEHLKSTYPVKINRKVLKKVK